MLNRRMRVLLLLVLLFAGSIVAARDVMQGETCTVEAEEVSHGTLFVLCERLDIRGKVEGNLIGGALRGTISGEVTGSIYLVGGEMVITGTVAREVHYAGLSLTLTAQPVTEITENTEPQRAVVGGGLMTFTLNTTLAREAHIRGGIISGGYQTLLYGQVDEEVNFWGSALTVDGTAGDDVIASVGDPANDGSQIETLLLPFSFELQLGRAGLTVTDSARIDGILSYTGVAEGDIPEALLKEPDKVFYRPTVVALPTLEEPAWLRIYFDQFMREATTLLSIGLMILLFFPELFRAPMAHLRARPVASLSVGMLAFILSFPVVLIVALLTLLILIILQLLSLSGVTVAVGAVLGIVNLGSISVFYFVAIFVARVLVGFTIGRFLARLIWGYSSDARVVIGSMVLGVVVLALLISIPVIGSFFNAGALFLGLGTILSVVLEKFQRLRETAPAAVPAWYPPSQVVARSYEAYADDGEMPAVTVPDDETTPTKPPTKSPTRTPTEPVREIPLLPAPGMADLPEGFDFKFFED